MPFDSLEIVKKVSVLFAYQFHFLWYYGVSNVGGG